MVQCRDCQRWVHLKCTRLPAYFLTYILCHSNSVYVCAKCQRPSESVMQAIGCNEPKTENMKNIKDSQLKAAQKEIESLKNKLTERDLERDTSNDRCRDTEKQGMSHSLEYQFIRRDYEYQLKECSLKEESVKKELNMEIKLRQSLENQLASAKADISRLQVNNDRLIDNILEKSSSAQSKLPVNNKTVNNNDTERSTSYPPPASTNHHDNSTKLTFIERQQLKYNGTISFRGGDDEFSNFHMCEVIVNDKMYKSNEHYYQSEKAEFHGDYKIAEAIREAKDARTAREIAKEEITTNQEWQKQKVSILKNGVMAKLRCNPHIKDMLMATKGKYLLEDTPIYFWGKGRNGKGQNKFGEILMDIRDNELSTSTSDVNHKEATPTPTRHDEHDQGRAPFNSQRKQHQRVLALGNSQFNNVKTYKFSRISDLHKVQLFTLDETKDWLLESNNTNVHKDSEYVVIHQITNDVKSNTIDQCVDKMEECVNICKEKFSNAQVVISLATPRDDGLQYKAKAVNSALYDKYSKGKDSRVILCHHENMAENNKPKPIMIAGDKYHLSSIGTKMLASNIRFKIEPGRKEYLKEREKYPTNENSSGRPTYSMIAGMSNYGPTTGEKPHYIRSNNYDRSENHPQNNNRYKDIDYRYPRKSNYVDRY